MTTKQQKTHCNEMFIEICEEQIKHGYAVEMNQQKIAEYKKEIEDINKSPD